MTHSHSVSCLLIFEVFIFSPFNFVSLNASNHFIKYELLIFRSWNKRGSRFSSKSLIRRHCKLDASKILYNTHIIDIRKEYILAFSKKKKENKNNILIYKIYEQ